MLSNLLSMLPNTLQSTESDLCERRTGLMESLDSIRAIDDVSGADSISQVDQLEDVYTQLSGNNEKKDQLVGELEDMAALVEHYNGCAPRIADADFNPVVEAVAGSQAFVPAMTGVMV